MKNKPECIIDTIKKVVLIVCLVAVPLCGSAQNSATQTSSMLVKMRGPLNYLNEQCVDFTSGDEVQYRFASKHPVKFDIHYHSHSNTSFAVEHEEVSSHSGRFVVGDIAQYCFTFVNKQRLRENWQFTMEYSVLPKNAKAQ